MRAISLRVWPLVFAAIAITTSTMAAAQYTGTALYSFGGVAKEPQNPTASLVFDSAHNLYGTSPLGGQSGSGGAVFELSPSTGGGWTQTVLYSFVPNTDDASNPSSGLIFDDAGNLYGESQSGGVNSNGTVYELSPSASGWTETVLYRFAGGSDGAHPTGGLVLAGGNLYGVTVQGGGQHGCSQGCGTVFELSPSTAGWTEKIIYSFTGKTDGANPGGKLALDAVGNLYGVAFAGGNFTVCHAGCGTVFRLTPAGDAWTFHRLFTFQGSGGAGPTSLVLDARGNVYGTTEAGGPKNSGVIFKLTRPASSGAWTKTNLYVFTNEQDGSDPSGVAFDESGNLFGTAITGSTKNAGTAFEISHATGSSPAFSALFSFGDTLAEGSGPSSGVILDSDGNLFGTAPSNGAFFHGVVFELSPPPAASRE